MAAVLLGTACSGGEQPASDSPATDAPDAESPDEPNLVDPLPPSDDEPGIRHAEVGDGVAITMARSDDPDGRFQAEVTRQLLERLGYAVTDPADIELSPGDFYDALGRGEVDLWVNARFPEHDQYLDLVIRIEPFVTAESDTGEGRDDEVIQQPETTGSALEIIVRDELTIVGSIVADGGVAGFITNASIAFGNPDLTLDAIVENEVLFDLYDGADHVLSPALAAGDGAEPVDTTDGVIKVLGCPENALCADQIDEMIRFAGWQGFFEQVHGDRDVLAKEALRRIAADQPVIAFVRGPSAELTQLIPGENVVWISMEPGSVLDGSITRAWNQRLENEDGEQVPNPVESETCSANPCHLGWLTNDIAITASKAFLERYPAAATLLASIEIPVTDVNKAIARIRFDDLPSGTPDKTSQVAREWIESNRKLVEGWLETAVAAA
jgi:glycine betaine/proline transport system substrate-binding protein